MRKLIVVKQENLLICDNESCDYVLPNVGGGINECDMKDHIGLPCPKCGDNLLTEEDYKSWVVVTSIINFLNKYFSWLTFFIPESKDLEDTTITIHAHKGIHIEKKED